MGNSKSYRGAPGWQKQNTPRGEYTYSTGSRSTAEGTLMSGEDEWGRKGMKSSARNKSSSRRAPARNSGPYGES